MDQRLALYEQRAIDSGTSRRPQLTTRAKGVNTHRREAPSAEINLSVSGHVGQRSVTWQSDEIPAGDRKTVARLPLSGSVPL